MRNDMTSRGAVKEVNGDHQKHRDKEPGGRLTVYWRIIL